MVSRGLILTAIFIDVIGGGKKGWVIGDISVVSPLSPSLYSLMGHTEILVEYCKIM